MVNTHNPTFERQRQEDVHKFAAGLGNTVITGPTTATDVQTEEARAGAMLAQIIQRQLSRAIAAFYPSPASRIEA